MVVVEIDPDVKKRKKVDGDVQLNNSQDSCAIGDSPRKIIKLIPPGHPSTSQLSYGSKSDDYNESESDSSQESTVNSFQNSVIHNHNQNDERFQKSLKTAILKLDGKQVFTRLLLAFSQENLPDKISYAGQHYTLVPAYDEFWKTFFDSEYYSEGHESKIPRVQNLIDLELKSLMEILKRGWMDERYLPDKLSRPFLESCLFGEASIESITPEVFLKFIDPSEKALIENLNEVDQTVISIFNKYLSNNPVSIGDDIKESCIKAAYEIMVLNMKPIIDMWSKKLNDLVPKSTFNFLMGPCPIPKPPQCEFLPDVSWTWMEVDMEGGIAPHKLWKTFFLDWPEDKVKFYFRLLARDSFGKQCNLCGDDWFDAKHFLCKCSKFLDTLYLERHDAVLEILLNQVYLAIVNDGPYFGKGNDWKVLSSQRNDPYVWPEEMNALRRMSPQKYPHIIVYSMSPKKQALIIEYSVSWEYWMHVQTRRKTLHYSSVKEELEKIGFKVEYRVFTLGSRGVFIPELYKMFDEIFGMNHSAISKTMEEISQEIIDVPYRSKHYKELIK